MVEDVDTAMKVVLIGDSAVGKTCFFNRVIYEKYDDGNLSTFSTLHRAKDYSNI